MQNQSANWLDSATSGCWVCMHMQIWFCFAYSNHPHVFLSNQSVRQTPRVSIRLTTRQLVLLAPAGWIVYILTWTHGVRNAHQERCEQHTSPWQLHISHQSRNLKKRHKLHVSNPARGFNPQYAREPDSAPEPFRLHGARLHWRGLSRCAIAAPITNRNCSAEIGHNSRATTPLVYSLK